MGSDMAMNPPKEQFDTYVATTEDEVVEYVVGALATDHKIVIGRKSADGWHISVATGQWI